MKILIQLGIILTICFFSQALSSILPFPIPGPIIALILILLFLLLKWIKEDQIKDVGDYLLSNMAFFFVPSGVKILEYFEIIKKIYLELIIIGIITSVLVLVSTSFAVQLTVKLMKKHERNNL